MLKLFFLILFPFLFLSAEDSSTVSVYAVHMPTGKVVLSENSEKSMIPASCMKLVTTGAALHLLGPEGMFQTELQYAGEIDKEGVLHGNLYIKGGGDPCLGSDRVASALSWQKQVEVWAEAVCAQGIRTIEGRVIPDDTVWEKARAAPGWQWEDLGNYYGAGASALSFNENSYKLVFQPGKREGEPSTLLRTDPSLERVVFQNEVKTGPEGSGDQACIYAAEGALQPVVRGTIPLGVSEFTLKGALPDPGAFCAEKLKEVLQKKGVAVLEGNCAKGIRHTFHTTRSPSLREIVYWVNQKSVNLYAEHLLKKMGEVVKKEGSTRAGTQAVVEFWRSQGIDLEGFNMADGSGLSRTNLVTAKQLVSILIKMRASTPFFESLAEREPQVRGKNGSMRFVKGYAGYKGEIAFAILVNHCTSREEAQKKIENFLKKIPL